MGEKLDILCSKGKVRYFVDCWIRKWKERKIKKYLIIWKVKKKTEWESLQK